MGKTNFNKIIQQQQEKRSKTVNPLHKLVITGNIEIDDKNEWDAIEDHLKKVDKVEDTQKNVLLVSKNALERNQNLGYVIPLIFVTQEQADEFLKLAGWGKHADSTGAYFDGIAIAKELGHDLKPTPINFSNGKPALRLVKECGVFERR